MCLCSSPCWFLPAARHLWYTWEVGINDLLLWAFSGCFCQVPSSPSPNLSYFTSKDENSSRSITGEKTIWYNTLREKMIYIDIGNKLARTKPTSYEKILKIRRLLLIHIRRIKQERNKQKITFSFTYLTTTYFLFYLKNYLSFFFTIYKHNNFS